MKKNQRLLFNPFVRIAGWKGTAVGCAIVCVVVVVGWMNDTYFPAVVDGKIATAQTFSDFTLGSAFAVMGIALAVTALLFWLGGLVLSRETRLQDILATVTIARAPFIISALAGGLVDMDALGELSETLRAQASAGEMPELSWITPVIISGLIMLLMGIWSVILLFNGYKTSTGLKGAKLGVSFTLLIIAAEVMSHIVTYYLMIK